MRLYFFNLKFNYRNSIQKLKLYRRTLFKILIETVSTNKKSIYLHIFFNLFKTIIIIIQFKEEFKKRIKQKLIKHLIIRHINYNYIK